MLERSVTSAAEDHLRTSAERGYTVIPNVVPWHLLDAALLEIDGLTERELPPVDRRGFHFYWRNGPATSDPLLAPFTDSPALALAEAMVPAADGAAASVPGLAQYYTLRAPTRRPAP